MSVLKILIFVVTISYFSQKKAEYVYIILNQEDENYFLFSNGKKVKDLKKLKRNEKLRKIFDTKNTIMCISSILFYMY